jgi:hypothetical protein
MLGSLMQLRHDSIVFDPQRHFQHLVSAQAAPSFAEQLLHGLHEAIWLSLDDLRGTPAQLAPVKLARSYRCIRII